jgi:RNA polymerase sigma-70 factor (ECF subfamily)
MSSESEILNGCIKGKPSAQRELYEQHSRILLGICIRYAGSVEEAEDILQEGFVKIFRNITHFKGEGSLTAWMRRIMINTAITAYHKSMKHRYQDDISEIRETDMKNVEWNEADFTAEELKNIIQLMPNGYRMIFNLYAIEGYKHREIAVMLEIDENTSKSQYSRARRWLQERLLKLKAEVTNRKSENGDPRSEYKSK